MLEIINVFKAIKEKKIISDISFNVNYGEIFGLLGPNGAGKTSTFYIIAGLINADNGKVILEKEDITTMPMHLRSNLGLKYLEEQLKSLLELVGQFNQIGGIFVFYMEQKQQDSYQLTSHTNGRKINGLRL